MSDQTQNSEATATTIVFLQTVWSDVLNISTVLPEDNFLDLGGDSIAAALCLNRIAAAYGIDLEVEALLVETLTLREIAALIDSSVARRCVNSGHLGGATDHS